MGTFEYEQISSLNEKEFEVYNYISTHQQDAVKMNIRELAEKTGVSTTTVLRTCRKVGCEGYTELKYQMRKQLQPESGNGQETRLFRVRPVLQYLQHAIEDQELDAKLEKLAQACVQSQTLLVAGTGIDAGLARYGAYLLSKTGLAAYAVDDPHYPVPAGARAAKMVLLVLVSAGEDDRVVPLMNGCRKFRAHIASITNTDQCMAAKLSDTNFSCYMPVSGIHTDRGGAGIATQIPAVFLLEQLADRVYGLLKN